VAAMLEGVLRHATDMEVEKNYVDSHGQSEVGFAFCHLLGFQLLPRLKHLKHQKLYRPDKGEGQPYTNLHPILTRPIHWDLIAQQYDEMMKFATALRLGTADAEAILRRFTRDNASHPTYQALKELGREGSGHFRAKIYSKPEAPVMRQHTAKKQSVFHTELHVSWSIKVLKIDMPRVPRQWSGLSWLPFARVGWLIEAKRQPISTPGSGFPPLGLHRLGLYGLYQNQQPVDKSARFLRRALKSQMLRLSV
jgi:hypothetical protein